MATNNTINRIELIGYMGAMPELRFTASGTPVTNFSLATNRIWRDQAGEQRKATDWHHVSIMWNYIRCQDPTLSSVNHQDGCLCGGAFLSRKKTAPTPPQKKASRRGKGLRHPPLPPLPHSHGCDVLFREVVR